MTERPDVLIVGGGIIGCALAAELAGRGRTVTVLERGEPGAEASGAAAGMLTPQSEARGQDAFFDLALESRNMYPAWIDRLCDETGLEVGYRRTGRLNCGYAGEAAGRIAARYEWQRAAGLALVERSGGALAAEIGGRLSSEVSEAIFFPDEAVVDPRRLTRAVWLLAERRGVRVRTGTPVLAFRIDNGTCRGVETAAGPIEAETIVDAAGAWAAFDARLPVELPIGPVRGQIVALRLPGDPLETIVSSDDVYVVPRADGTVLIGSTVEFVGYRNEVTAAAVGRLITAASRLVPSLGAAAFVTAWSGLRPGTPDGLPVLGASPVRRLYFAAGHFRNGILLAPVTARRLSELLDGRGEEALAPFSVERFAGAPARI